MTLEEERTVTENGRNIFKLKYPIELDRNIVFWLVGSGVLNLDPSVKIGLSHVCHTLEESKLKVQNRVTLKLFKINTMQSVYTMYTISITVLNLEGPCASNSLAFKIRQI